VWLVFVSTVMLMLSIASSSSEVKSVSNSMGSPFLSHGSPSQHESTPNHQIDCAARGERERESVCVCVCERMVAIEQASEISPSNGSYTVTSMRMSPGWSCRYCLTHVRW